MKQKLIMININTASQNQYDIVKRHTHVHMHFEVLCRSMPNMASSLFTTGIGVLPLRKTCVSFSLCFENYKLYVLVSFKQNKTPKNH